VGEGGGRGKGGLGKRREKRKGGKKDRELGRR